MIRPAGAAGSELVIHAVALYLPVIAVVVLAVGRGLTRARLTGAVLATAWNVAALLALNLIAVRVGWWSFGTRTPAVAGVPVGLWLGWALLWGAVPILATTRRLFLAGTALFAMDVVLMPAGQPAVVLGVGWLVGEAVALGTCLVPGLLLGRWTATNRRVGYRALLQAVAFGGILLLVLPALVFTVTGEGWEALLRRPRWQLLAAAGLFSPAVAAAIQAVRELAIHGGTPVPSDPPTSLVTSGPYAYVANPMQLGATVVLAAWGSLLGSPAVVAAAGMAAIFSSGLAAWSEENQMSGRFGEGWSRYRRHVRPWIPRWRPAPGAPAVVNLAWAVCSWMARLPLRRAVSRCVGSPTGRASFSAAAGRAGSS